jgi:hypothetical protein
MAINSHDTDNKLNENNNTLLETTTLLFTQD